MMSERANAAENAGAGTTYGRTAGDGIWSFKNVASKVDRPKKNDFQPVFLSAEEAHKMFEALMGTKLDLPFW